MERAPPEGFKKVSSGMFYYHTKPVTIFFSIITKTSATKSYTMKIRTFIVDSFTDKAFKGNPAGVCLLDKPLSVETMQSIASEINLSETAFLVPGPASESHFNVRYFTPTVEIAFCGHATLASAKVILHKLGKNNISFTTHYNLQLSASREGDNIMMKFPLYGTSNYQPSNDLYQAFGIHHPLAARLCKELDMLIIEVKDKETLLQITPDFAKALKSSDEVKEVVVTAKSADKEFDFYSRCFCPWIGINEDPVTGASHSVLAKYWGDKLTKTEMNASQVSRRGGFMSLKITGATELEVRSNAKIIFEGVLDTD